MKLIRFGDPGAEKPWTVATKQQDTLKTSIKSALAQSGCASRRPLDPLPEVNLPRRGAGIFAAHANGCLALNVRPELRAGAEPLAETRRRAGWARQLDPPCGRGSGHARLS